MERLSNREVISRVRGLFKLQSTDTYVNIPDRLILAELQSTALSRIKQTTDKRALWNSPNIFKTIPCLILEQVPLAQCSIYTGSNTVARSVVQLPKIAEGTKFGMLIQGIYSIDLVSRRFIESTPDRYVNSLYLGLRTNAIHYWIQDKYLYIGDQTISRVKIAAYFEEDIPETLLPYPDYCGNTLKKGCCPQSDEISLTGNMALCCPPNPYDEEFPAPGYMVTEIIETVSRNLLNTYKRSVADGQSDQRDSTK